MQITRTNNSPTNTTLMISLEPAELEHVKNHVISHHFANVKIPGFRVGTAPAQIIEKNIDPASLTNEFLDHAINEYYRKAVEQEKLRPVGQPQVEIKKFVPYTTMEFEITQDVVGTVKLPDYKKIKLAKPKTAVTAKDVDGVLSSLRLRAAERQEVDRPSKTGDEVVIDFAGKDAKGQPVSGADGKDFPLTLGSKAFIHGFEEELVGLKPGGKKKITVTFPKDYGVAALQNKKVTFDVEVKKIHELNEPKLDDEFAKKTGPFKSLAELKSDIKKQLQQERERQAEIDYQNELVRKISDKATLEVPKALVDDQIMHAEEEEKRNLMFRGQTWEEHLKEEGVTEEQHRERQRPQAEEMVKGGLVLNEISSKEGLSVAPEELDERIAQLKAQYQDEQMRAELDKPENRQEIAARLLTEKTLNLLAKHASK